MNRAPRWDVVVAHACVWVVWGSTYLAIRLAIDNHLPPLGLSSARFLVAGALLFAVLRWRGVAAPQGRQWTNTAAIGFFLVFAGNGAVSWAEKTVPSGLVALTVAILPAWMVLLEWAVHGQRPTRPLVLGLLLGFVGVAVLVGPDDVLGGGAIPLATAALLMAGSASWAGGSIYARSAVLPDSPFMATAAEMMWGGAFLGVASWATGEPGRFVAADVTLVAILAWLYLVVFGAIIAFTAYIYLLGNTTAAQASTYAFVNPVIAVVLGWGLAAEPMDARVLVAGSLVVAAVVLIIRYRDR